MPRLPLPPAEPMRLVQLADIAKGGMGSVQMARVDGGRFHGQIVAVKRLNANVAQDPQFVGMFLDEAWMTAALQSPNVVSALAWGNDPDGMFLAVELVAGVSLWRLIKEAREHGEVFAERTVAFIGSQICSGLVAAHGLRGPDGALLGLVHRDLTPGNILVSFEGLVKIADFGIAKAEERITHTQTGTLKGKPAYMAPEQARGGKIDARSDFFSFGVMLFELLAGRKPWMSKSTFDVMMEAATAPTPNLGEIRKGISPVFIEIANRCLAKKPEERFSTAEEIQALLDGWRRSRGFGADDQASLGSFVQRNSATQIDWYTRAMRGEFARGEALTFKEIEEQIDESREKKAPPKPRPAAGGTNHLVQMTPGKIKPAAGSPPSVRSSSVGAIPPPPPSQRNLPSPTSPPRKSLTGTEKLDDHVRAKAFAKSGTPPSDPNPGPSSRAPMNLGGTQLMQESPFASHPRPRPPAAPPPSSPQTRQPPSSDRGSGGLGLPPRRMGAPEPAIHLPPQRAESPSNYPSPSHTPPPPSQRYDGVSSGPLPSAPFANAGNVAPISAAPQYAPPPYSPHPGPPSSSNNYPAPHAAPMNAAPMNAAPMNAAPMNAAPMNAAPMVVAAPVSGGVASAGKPPSSTGTILLVVTIALIAGGGAAWLLRDRWLQGPAPGKTGASAAPSHAAPNAGSSH